MLNRLNDFLSSIVGPTIVDDRPEHTLQLATAVLLIEVMQSDDESTDQEQAAVLNILKERFNLADAEVTQLTELGHHTANAANDCWRRKKCDHLYRLNSDQATDCVAYYAAVDKSTRL